MKPRFTRGEYWIIESVVECRIPLCWLISDSIEELLNKPGHGLAQASLVDTLYRLLSLDLIYIEGSSTNSLISSQEQIKLALFEKKFKKLTYYGITQKGGFQWEAFAAPNWQEYIYESYKYPDNTEDNEYKLGELICSNKDKLVLYFESLKFHRIDVVIESIHWDSIEPWQATYWKQLDKGYRLQFQCKDKEQSYVPPRPEFFDTAWYRWK